MSKPNCYDCIHRRSVPGDAHSSCANQTAKVTGSPHGVRMGWFYWPVNFDPTWLQSCDGFTSRLTVAQEPDGAEFVRSSVAPFPIIRPFSSPDPSPSSEPSPSFDPPASDPPSFDPGGGSFGGGASGDF